jgi:hypothetical protein
MTATMRFVTIAAAPLGSLVGGAHATASAQSHNRWVVGTLALGKIKQNEPEALLQGRNAPEESLTSKTLRGC